MDKIINGIMEIYPFYLPIFNILPIYHLVSRIKIYLFPFYDKDIKYYTTCSFTDVCYETI